MKLIKAKYEILTPINGEQILKSIELAARTCYKSEAKIGKWHKCKHCKVLSSTDRTEELCGKHFKYCNNSTENYLEIGGVNSHRLLVDDLLTRGHEAMIEFGGMITVRFTCDRGVTHELVRHRLSSFAQESTRYCNYGKDEHIQFIIPSWSKIEEGIHTIKEYDTIVLESGDDNWWCHMYSCEKSYNALIRLGWSPQQARSILPNSLKTEINVSANIREWRHIFQQRVANATHPDMRYLMRPLLDEFKTKIPLLFDDITY